MTRQPRWGSIAAVLLFSALALGGCGGPQVAPSPGNPAFYVVNQGSAPIHNIYVTSVNVSGWGGDVLGDSVLQPGQRHRVNPPRGECVFDVRVVWKGGRAEERRRQDLCRVTEIAFAGPGSGAPTTQGSSNPDFFVVNNSQKTIQHIFVSTVQADKWGEDRMPGVLRPGERYTMRLPRDGQCQYDVRVIYEDKTTEERRRQDVCRIEEMAFNGSGAQPPRASSGAPPAPGGGAPQRGSGPSFGTAFFVSDQGYALTNHHVIEGCRSVAAIQDGRPVPAHVVRRDERNDLALIRVHVPVTVPFAKFRGSPGIRAGEGVVVAGYPLPSVLQNGMNVTTGNVSALAGMGGNTALMQITAPVQPGNSGGPLLDMSGNVVGVIVSKLNAMRVAQATGDIPQNINFAVQGAVARLFLESNGTPAAELQSTADRKVGDVTDSARAFTFQVQCDQ
jgi:S1-C subfamily serine protease